MGTGKSTIGKLLSKDLDLNFIDTDKQIEKHFNMPINNIFDQHGEPSFRKIESRVLQKVTESIVACGGGIIVKKENRDFIKLNGTSLLLNSKMNLLENRLKDSSNRPLLNDNDLKQQLEKIWNERKDLYFSLADHVIDINSKTKTQIVDQIIGIL